MRQSVISLGLFLVASILLTSIDAKASTIYSLTASDDSTVVGNPTYVNMNFNGSNLSTYDNGGAGSPQWSLLHFSLGSLPAGAIIGSASLVLNANTGVGNNSSNLPIDVYRVTSSWLETQVTWNNRLTSTPWTSPGGDFVGTTGVANVNPYATNSSNPANHTNMTWDVTTLVQQWYTGAFANDGLEVKAPIGVTLVYDSKEARYGGGSQVAPLLLVTIVPEPSSVLLLGIGVFGLLAFRRAVKAGR